MGVAIDRRTENGGTEKKQKPRHPLAVSLARVQIGKAAGIYARLQDNLLTMHRLQALDTLVTRFVQNAGGFDITATGSGDSSVTLKPRGKVNASLLGSSFGVSVAVFEGNEIEQGRVEVRLHKFIEKEDSQARDSIGIAVVEMADAAIRMIGLTDPQETQPVAPVSIPGIVVQSKTYRQLEQHVRTTAREHADQKEISERLERRHNRVYTL